MAIKETRLVKDVLKFLNCLLFINSLHFLRNVKIIIKKKEKNNEKLFLFPVFFFLAVQGYEDHFMGEVLLNTKTEHKLDFKGPLRF